MKYLCCVTHDYIRMKAIQGLRSCPGVDSMHSTHCAFCEYYEGDPEENKDDEVENPVIRETEVAEWN